jgi:EAL domain-containing protein (putative c-di-GMP-specific phosphodiesterase class I)
VAQVLKAHDLTLGALHLEITETAIISDVVAAAEQIATLRALGVKVAIDDFGAGESSLSYQNHSEVDIVKIDRQFTMAISEQPKAARLMAGMLRLLDSLGVDVVCEGVAEADQYVELKSMGCKVGQGFYLARPAPASEITQFLHLSRSHESRRARQR